MRSRGILLLLTLVVLPNAVRAQFFVPGENKVQYRRLDWQVLRGPRVDVYFYPAEAELARVALAYAEESYDVLSLKFGHTVASRVPMVVYASHTDFEQTNILPFTPPEGLLGVTDYLKRRVTLPFRGNMAEFRHTLRHEMVHVFQISLMIDRYNRSPRAGVDLPLWWTEGLAELWSGGEDARDEMILRDMILGEGIPPLQSLNWAAGGIVYPLGGRIHRWLADTYGDWRVATFYRTLWRYDTFEAAIAGVYGRSLKQLNEEFQVAMRRAYYPAIAGHTSLPAAARRIASSALKPSYLADSAGGSVLYATGGDGTIRIEEQQLDGGGQRTLITSGGSVAFENVHPFDSRIDGSRPGLLLLSSRYQDRDALIVYDRVRNRVVGRYQFPGLVSLLSPVWGPDGHSVVLSGLAENGVSDLYRVHLPEGTLEHLTEDIYQDLDPSLSPDGRQVVFASDRTANGLHDAVNLFVLDLETRQIRQLTYGDWIDETPRWVDTNRILFSSSRDGVLNVFSVDTLGAGHRETSAWTGAFDAAAAGERRALLVTGFDGLNLGVYLYPLDSMAGQEQFTTASPPPHSTWTWPTGESGELVRARDQPYRRKYGLDFATGGIAYAPRVGTGQGATVMISDLLSDNLFFFNFTTYQGRGFRSVFANVSILGLYLNQTRRVNWGVGAFRFKGNQYEGDFVPSYSENTTGVFGLLRYPLSRFARIEGEASVAHSDRVDFTLPFANPVRKGWITDQSISYIHDNALWTTTGPVAGHFLSATTGVSSDFSNARFDSYTSSLDARQYLRLGRRAALAFRGFGFYSGGDRPGRVNIGGTLGLRGYPNYGYILGSQAWMLNGELRFPLLDYFTLGTVAGAARFPEIQGAVFGDVGQATQPGTGPHAILGSYGVGFRWPLLPGLVLRLDWGRRFSDSDFQGYGLTPRQKTRGFLQFFFGYNY
jgi:hypothetical protein